MKIKNLEDAKKVRKLVGEQNFKAFGRALKDGASIWVFKTRKEIESDPDLDKDEKLECKRILREEKMGYAGWLRLPKRSVNPLLVPTSGYDSHGNSRGGGGGGHDSIH